MKHKLQYNKGAAMITLVIFMILTSLTIIVGIVTPVVREFQIASDSYESKQTYFTAESGLEDAMYRLKNGKQIGSSEVIVLGDSSTTTTITDLGSNQKELSSLGDTNSNQRKVNITLTTGSGSSFNYGVQTGQGGLFLGNNAVINGNVYSNGPIVGSPGAAITGSASVANSPALTADQSNVSPIPPSTDVIFGDSSASQDIAQSFRLSTSSTVNKIRVYLKKTSTPSNLTVRIVADSAGSPGSSTLTSGVLSASNITTSYGFVDVPMSTTVQLLSTNTYWIVLDGTNNSSKYYTIGGNTSYGSGLAKLGQHGGSWGTISGNPDIYFEIYLGGFANSISDISIGTAGVGNARANTVNNSTISGSLYCQNGSGNNKACDTSQPDPTPANMPISDANIIAWKNDATAGGTISGSYTLNGSNASLGPKKIIGNLTVDNGAVLTLTGTLWVTGNVIIDNNAIVKLSSSYGANSGMIIADGTIDFNNNSTCQGSGTSGTYVMTLTTSNASNAITIGNNTGSNIAYAPYGNITLTNNATIIEATGYTVTLTNNVTLNYQTGLASVGFSSGPSGSWNINTWKEVE